MSEGVDYSFSQPSAAGLAAAGKRFAGRYVGPGSGKFLTIAERDALFAAGLDIFLLVEGNANSAAGGYAIGVQHAQLAISHARQLGAPESAAFYFAVDYDVSSKGWAGPREYLRGACSVLGLGRVGVYGEHDVMGWAQRDGVAAWFFQTYAWSNGLWFAGNHVEQYHNGVIVAGGEVDLCRSGVGNFGQWRADGKDPSTRPPAFAGPKEVEMIGLRDAEGGEFTVEMSPLSATGYYWTPVVDPGRSRVLQAGGLVMVDNAKVDNKVDVRPGMFGPSAAEVREQLVADIAAKVVKLLPSGGGGKGPTLDEIRKVVDEQLDQQSLGGADKD